MDPRPRGDGSDAPAQASARTTTGEAGVAGGDAAGAEAGAGFDLSPAAADLLGALDSGQTDEEAGVGRMIAGEVARALSSPATPNGYAAHRRQQSRWRRRP